MISIPSPAPPPDPLVAAREKLQALPLDSIPEPAPLPQPYRMPLSRNPQFVGREHDLRHLARALKGGAMAAIGQVEIAGVTGMGGIGKTQLACEFVHRYGQFFRGGVFWLSFADPQAVAAEVAACGGPSCMDLPDLTGLSLADQVAHVQRVWGKELPRLLVFDNCEDEALLDEWRPTAGGARVLVTSRRTQWPQLPDVEAVALGVLDRDESIALLRQHRPELPPDEPSLGTVAAELGDLPLALHLAGSYLAQYKHRITPDQYIAQLRTPTPLQHRSLQRSGLSPTKHVLDVNRTFALSYEAFNPADPTDAVALALLARAACFAAGEAIPRDLLLLTLEQPEDDLDAQLPAEDALSRLVDLGLLESEAGGALRIHRLVVAFVKAVQPGTDAQMVVEQMMLRIANHFNNEGYPAPLLELQAHLRAITDRVKGRSEDLAASLCNTFGYHLQMIGDYAAARPYYERALAINEQVLGASHPDTARSLNNLGGLLQAQGDYQAARPYYERALAIREQVLGASHPDTATSLNNLGFLLRAQGDYQAARPYYERALAINEQVLGASHPDTATSLNNLGFLLRAQGDYQAARPYYERALAINEQVLGASHPDTATSLNNLGFLLRAQGDYQAARPYYERALAINEQVLGASHPDTATSLNNLGFLLRAQGDYQAARPYYERALAIREQVLGASHPDTATSLNNLGGLLQAQGDYQAARPYYERALAICEQRLGLTHPTTQAVRNNLAALAQTPQSAAEQSTAIKEAAQQAVERVLNGGTAEQRAALAVQLEAVARQAEAGEHEGSPYLALAVRLRELRTRLENTEPMESNPEQLDEP